MKLHRTRVLTFLLLFFFLRSVIFSRCVLVVRGLAGVLAGHATRGGGPCGPADVHVHSHPSPLRGRWRRGDVLSQNSWPWPLKPGGQVQEKEPTELMHLAFTPHALARPHSLRSRHSSCGGPVKPGGHEHTATPSTVVQLAPGPHGLSAHASTSTVRARADR